MPNEPEQLPLGELIPGTKPRLGSLTDFPDSTAVDPDTTRAESGHRGPDPEIGIPIVMPLKVGAALPDQANRNDCSTDIDDSLQRRAWAINVSAVAVILMLLGGFGLFICSQVLQILGELRALSTVPQTLGYVVLGILVLVVFFAFLRLCWLWYRLRASPQISLKRLRELSMRRSLRRMSADERGKARRLLYFYIERFSVDDKETAAFLRGAGLNDDQISTLQRKRRQLLDRSVARGDSEWLDMFNICLSTTLDQAADSMILARVRWVAAKTAVSSVGKIDSVIVAYNSFALVGELARLYQVRTSTIGTAYLLVNAFANTYLAGRIEESFDDVAHSIHEHVAGFVGVAAAKISSRVADGVANGLLIYRLGTAARRLIRPLRE